MTVALEDDWHPDKLIIETIERCVDRGDGCHHGRVGSSLLWLR